MLSNQPLRLLAWLLPVSFCLSGLTLLAQVQELATTDDGSKLFFSSNLRLKGTSEYNNSKIFELAAGNFNLFAQTTPSQSMPNGTVVHYDLHLPNPTGDGAIVTFDETVVCQYVTGNCKGNVENTQTTIGGVLGASLPAEMTSSGSLRVSHNGRYFLRFCCINSGDPPSVEFYDSQTGVLTPIPGFMAIGDGRQSIADDGTVLLAPYSGPLVMSLWNQGNLKQLPIKTSINDAAHLSADRSVIVYQGVDLSPDSATPGDAVLFAYNVSTGATSTLAKGPYALPLGTTLCSCGLGLGVYFRPSVSNDGSRILFQAADPLNGGFSSKPPQLYVTNADGTGLRQLTAEPSGIAESALSGDGHRAYAVTPAGDLLTINVDSGTVERLLGDLPSFDVNAPVPGSRAIVSGQRLTTSDGQPLVHFNEFDAPLISARPNQVMLQVPWEVDVSQAVTLTASAAVSPFELVRTYQPVASAPLFLDVLHTDFRGEPTDKDPAHPGEILVLQMTGLGPVSPAVSTGKPAPDSPLSYALLKLSCDVQGLTGHVPAPVLFAGLAPEMVGMYQVNLKIPDDIPIGNQLLGTYITCAVGSSGALSPYIYIGTPP